jgi:hypothetical protein
VHFIQKGCKLHLCTGLCQLTAATAKSQAPHVVQKNQSGQVRGEVPLSLERLLLVLRHSAEVGLQQAVCPYQMICEWKCTSGGMILTGEDRREKTVPVLRRPPQILHGLTSARTQTSAVRSPLLRACTMAVLPPPQPPERYSLRRYHTDVGTGISLHPRPHLWHRPRV